MYLVPNPVFGHTVSDLQINEMFFLKIQRFHRKGNYAVDGGRLIIWVHFYSQ
jgi:hypothetical protein